MKERTLITGVVALLVAAPFALSGNTDVIFIAASIVFFGLCAAYGAWCEKL